MVSHRIHYSYRNICFVKNKPPYNWFLWDHLVSILVSFRECFLDELREQKNTNSYRIICFVKNKPPSIDFHEAIWFPFMECFSQGLQKGTLLCSELLCGWILFYWITRMIALLKILYGGHIVPPKRIWERLPLAVSEDVTRPHSLVVSRLSGNEWFIGISVVSRRILHFL